MKVQMKWYNNPVWEYSARVYSKQDLTVTSNGQSNMYHMDGQSPSGFTNSNYNGWRADGGSLNIYASPIDVAAYVDLMNDEFQATAQSRIAFNGLNFVQAKDLLESGLEHFGHTLSEMNAADFETLVSP